MKAGITSLVAPLALFAFSGCGTLQSCSIDDPDVWPIYGGVACDIKHIQDNASAVKTIALRACDLPLSAAADTLMLPLTVTYAIARGLDRMDEAPPLSREAWERFWAIEPPPPEAPNRAVPPPRANP